MAKKRKKRKSKITRKMCDKLIDGRKSGLTKTGCAKLVGIDRTTLSAWINHPDTKLQSELARRWKDADAIYEQKLLQDLRMHSGKQWQATKYLLEVFNPDEYVVEKKQKNSVEANVKADVSLSDLFDDDVIDKILEDE